MGKTVIMNVEQKTWSV